jgi:hypothetical protein
MNGNESKQRWRVRGAVGLAVVALTAGSMTQVGASPAGTPGAGRADAVKPPYAMCDPDAVPQGFDTAAEAPNAPGENARFCTTPGFGHVPQNSANAPDAHAGTHSPTTYSSGRTGVAGTIYTTNPDVTHPAPSGTYEFVASQLFAYGSQAGGWLEVGWVESDGFSPSTGNAQNIFTFDPHGGGWQLHYSIAPNQYYSYNLQRCQTGDANQYCAYTYLSNGTWGLLRRSATASGCTSTCQMAHILVEVQSTDSTPHPGLGGGIPFNGIYLQNGSTSTLWTSGIPTTETTDGIYLSCWSTRYHNGQAKKTSC